MVASVQRELVTLDTGSVVPTVARALRAQGIPPDVTPNWRTMEVAEKAEEIYRQLARPVGVWASVGRAGFEAIFAGEGHNADATPVEQTVRRADSLALFAVTLGREVPRAISDLFDRQDPALASMLDAYASEGVELAAERLENRYVDSLTTTSGPDPDRGVLRYSPGYCGWHVTGQRKLFQFLNPGDVGISLGKSCLMQPLKSVSGVIISGRREIFDFENTYDFCEECSDWVCRERIAAVMGETTNGSA